MKKKPSLGELIRIRRESIGLSQRELGSRAGVTASHIAYIECGRRRPSYTLLFRLGQGLNLSRRELFFLAYPEATTLFDPMPEGQTQRAAWDRFLAVARRYNVTADELAVLRKISQLGKISSPSKYLSILNSIRQSLEQEPDA
jgi:transcriptional regulator with XRE-family HTH domain